MPVDSSLISVVGVVILVGLLVGAIGCRCAPADPAPAATSAEWEGRRFVHRDLGYLLRVETFHPDGPEGPWLALVGEGGFRRMELPLSQQALLRPLVDEARAGQLEALVTRGAPVAGQGELDLRMYMLGTPEQAAIAVATLMERLQQAPDDEGAASDLRFAQLKLLGELAAVRGVPVAEYSADLQARRAAVPADQRTLRVPPPHVPVLPSLVLDEEALTTEGWHHATVPCSGETWSFGDGGTNAGAFDFHTTVPGGPGEWFASVHQLGDEKLDWLVLSQGAHAEVHAAESGFVVTVSGEEASLARSENVPSRTGLFVWMGDAPDDAASSVAHRMRTPMNLVMVWPFGGAVSPGRDGAFELHGAQLLDGRRVWAVHFPWDDDD